MTPSSDDEFDDPYEYNEELEVELQRLEKEAIGPHDDSTPKRDTTTISYELEAKPSISNAEADASEMQPAPSQNSTFEEELVDQVTSLLEPTTETTESQSSTATSDVKVIPISIDEDGNILQAIQVVQDDRSLFQRFRKREFFSVSDLVGPLWCEVQYDYRLRSKPYLKAEERPDVIITREGKHIPLDKVKAIDHDKTMKRGEVLHKKLEKEIHPVEVKVTTTSREDVWGLRFLNMLSSLQALLDIGKCRELPVVGFVRGYMVVGVIDELVLEKLPTSSQEPTRNSPERKSQRLLTSFFASNPTPRTEIPPRKRTHRLLLSDSKTRASGTLPKSDNARSGMTQLMCYKEILDSMLLASNDRRVSIAEGASSQKPADPGASSGSQADPISVEEDNMDSIVTASEKENGEERRPLNLNINTEQPFDRFSWHLLFRHLHLDPNVSLSDDFLFESRTVIYGNGLENRLYDGKCLWDYVDCWVDYVRRLGLGDPGNNRDPNGGKSEDRLELVYRNVRTTAQRKGKKRRSGQKDDPQQDSLSKDWTQTQAEVIGASAESLQLQEEARLLALAIEESLKQTKLDEVGVPDSAELTSLQDALYPSKSQTVGVIAKSERDELELDQGEAVVAPPTAEIVEADSVPATQNTQPVSASTSTTKPASARSEGSTKRKRPKDGSIIGSHVFHHDRSQLSKSLEGVLHFWMGIRQPEGVNIEHVSRCGWCEFEEGCEWRDQKAKEAVAKNRAQMKRE